jgi:hypothetical protein
LCDRLGWPKRAVMGARLIDWVAHSLPGMLQQHTPTDVNRLRPRSLHVALGLARTCAWLPAVSLPQEPGASPPTWVAGEERSLSLRSSWPAEWQDQQELDQSISVHHQTGRCIWEVHHPFSETHSPFHGEDDYRAFLDTLWRPLSLAEAVETECLHLEVLRMLVIGSGNVSPARALLDRVCSDECPTRGDVADSCERLIDNVWRYQIYR